MERKMRVVLIFFVVAVCNPANGEVHRTCPATAPNMPAKAHSLMQVHTEKKTIGGLSSQSIPEPDETVVSKNERHCEKSEFALTHACPEKCPYAAEMADQFCHFRCVEGNKCGMEGTVNNATIPSEKTRACRFCNVEACKTCKSGPPGAKGKELEFCLECFPGYFLTEEGECEMVGLWVFKTITVAAAIVVVVLVAWYLRVVTRPL
jgi:hypothetical protein